MPKKLEQVKVKSALADNRLALHERHPDHPDGEAMVYGDQEFTVARTPLVNRRLADEWIVRVEGQDERESGPANPPPPAEEQAPGEGEMAPAVEDDVVEEGEAVAEGGTTRRRRS